MHAFASVVRQKSRSKRGARRRTRTRLERMSLKALPFQPATLLIALVIPFFRIMMACYRGRAPAVGKGCFDVIPFAGGSHRCLDGSDER